MCGRNIKEGGDTADESAVRRGQATDGPLKPSASFHIFFKEILRAPGAQVYMYCPNLIVCCYR